MMLRWPARVQRSAAEKSYGLVNRARASKTVLRQVVGRNSARFATGIGTTPHKRLAVAVPTKAVPRPGKKRPRPQWVGAAGALPSQ